MKALIVYTSWFGQNRAVAEIIAGELARRGLVADCASVSTISVHDLVGYDLLVLGTYTHTGAASRQLRTLCQTIPLQQLDHLAVALFGTQIGGTADGNLYGGVDELEACLASRGCELALSPLRIDVSPAAAFLPERGLTAQQQRQIREFAADLWEASVPAPMI